MADHPPLSARSELYVATDVHTWEAQLPVSPDQDEICEECGYRRLTPEYYAWLRHRMEQAQRRHRCGQLAPEAYELLRTRFNTLHSWAVERFGEAVLMQALRDLHPGHYRPPRATPLDADPTCTEAEDPGPPGWRFFVLVGWQARAHVDAIRAQALALGWTHRELYQDCGRLRFPIGDDYGVICFLRAGDRINAVTAGFIEVTSARGVKARIYRLPPGRRPSR
jgi:hypothetical protein